MQIVSTHTKWYKLAPEKELEFISIASCQNERRVLSKGNLQVCSGNRATTIRQHAKKETAKKKSRTRNKLSLGVWAKLAYSVTKCAFKYEKIPEIPLRSESMGLRFSKAQALTHEQIYNLWQYTSSHLAIKLPYRWKFLDFRIYIFVANVICVRALDGFVSLSNSTRFYIFGRQNTQRKIKKLKFWRRRIPQIFSLFIERNEFSHWVESPKPKKMSPPSCLNARLRSYTQRTVHFFLWKCSCELETSIDLHPTSSDSIDSWKIYGIEKTQKIKLYFFGKSRFI